MKKVALALIIALSLPACVLPEEGIPGRVSTDKFPTEPADYCVKNYTYQTCMGSTLVVCVEGELDQTVDDAQECK